MLAYYGHPLSANQLETDEKYLICRNVPIARTGRYVYRAGELGLDGDLGRTVEVWRGEDEVFSPAAMASFEGKPVTDGHPPENVGPENFGAYVRGHAQNIRRSGDFLVADLYINDAALANDIRNSVKREVSCGYLCTYEPSGGGLRQTHIRGNHIAVVPQGRAGHAVAIQDAAPEAEKGRITPMSKLTHAILTAFGMAAKDASPEELPDLVQTTCDALDVEPADKAQETAPAKEDAADEMIEKAPKGDDLGSKLDKLIGMLESVMHKNDREEKKLSDEGDLDDLLERLTPEKKEEGSLTIPSDDACQTSARDAAVEIIRRVRPAVAAISDRQQRARVTDALLSCLGGGNVMQDILQASQDSARKAQDAKPGYDAVCREQEAAYAARNPHKNRKED